MRSVWHAAGSHTKTVRVHRAEFLHRAPGSLPHRQLMTVLPVGAAPPAIERITFRPEQAGGRTVPLPALCELAQRRKALTGWPVEQQEAFLQQQFQFQTLTTATTTERRSKSFLRPMGSIYVYHGADDIRLMDIGLAAGISRSRHRHLGYAQSPR
jgi:hypothetical protein